MIINYLLGALIGGAFGYFILYKLIGCSTGTCAITANPINSIIYGSIIGLLMVGSLNTPIDSEKNSSTPSEYKKLTAAEAKARIDSRENLIILDVRTQSEYDSEHIPNAILIPNERISDSMPELLPELDAEILVYCRSGNRSAQAAKKLIAIGYTNVYDFGGIMDWPYETVSAK